MHCCDHTLPAPCIKCAHIMYVLLCPAESLLQQLVADWLDASRTVCATRAPPRQPELCVSIDTLPTPQPKLDAVHRVVMPYVLGGCCILEYELNISQACTKKDEDARALWTLGWKLLSQGPDAGGCGGIKRRPPAGS